MKKKPARGGGLCSSLFFEERQVSKRIPQIAFPLFRHSEIAGGISRDGFFEDNKDLMNKTIDVILRLTVLRAMLLKNSFFGRAKKILAR
jgi:hypothetical protein